MLNQYFEIFKGRELVEEVQEALRIRCLDSDIGFSINDVRRLKNCVAFPLKGLQKYNSASIESQDLMKSQFFNPMIWFHEFLDAKSGLKAVGRRTSKTTGQNDELEDDITFDTLPDSLVNVAVFELLRTRNNSLIGNSHTKNDFTLETPAINSLDDCEDLEKLAERE